MMYAGNIILLSSSLINLKCMISIQFGIEMGISFDYLKSHCMAYHSHKAGYITTTMFSLDELKLSWVNNERYKGV